MAVTRLRLLVTDSSRDLLAKLTTRLEGAFAPAVPSVEYVRGSDGSIAELRVVLDDAVVPVEQQRALFRSLANLAGRADESFSFETSGATASDSNFDSLAAGVAPAGFGVSGTVTTEANFVSGPTTIHTDGGGGGTHDLSTTDITVDLPIVPGTLTLEGTISTSTETATDDGAGAFGTSTLLPSGGTIDYSTGAMTGTTAALDASSTLDETHTSDVSDSPLNAAKIDSGAAAGTSSLSQSFDNTAGVNPDSFSWSFGVLFDPLFGLNNNAVSGAQALTLNLYLRGAATGGGDINIQFSEVSDDATPPTEWGAPAFVGTAPAETPTTALSIDMDGDYHTITIRKVSDTVLGVDYDGVEETFTFGSSILLPSSVEVSHTWGDALDRHFNVDDWSFSSSTASAFSTTFAGLQLSFSA